LIEIACRLRRALHDERLVARIPPAMPQAASQHDPFAWTKRHVLPVFGRREPAADHFNALILIHMDVHRRPVTMRRQAAFDEQHLAAILDAARHVKPLIVVAVVKFQRLIHGCLPCPCYA